MTTRAGTTSGSPRPTEGRSSPASGHRVSVRDAFLRASNYYRSAMFFLHGDAADPRIRHAYDASVRCFREAAALFTPVIEPVEFPTGAPSGELLSATPEFKLTA